LQVKFIFFRFLITGKKGVVGAQPERALSWAQRVNIALSSAEALEFIHEKAEPCITPRVIKSSDILLFDNDVAKIIGDVGVFESDPDATIDPSKTYRYHPSTALSCYCAPEYATKIPYISVISDSSTRLGSHILSC